MYTIHADGQLLYSTASEAVESIVLSPRLTLDVEKAGSLSFTVPPGNSLHGKLKKMKTIVTVEQDNVQIFRGRVTETETDYYNQQNVYCEGERAFLLDSLHAPYTYSGSVQGLFSKLIANHNTYVETEKQFTVGAITAVSSSENMELESDDYVNTSEEIQDKLLDAYGGYLKTRTVGSTHYIDWLKQPGNTSGQTITFSVNLLDLSDKISAEDVFTVLIPLGYSEIDDDGEYTDPVDISSVNGGQKYIQDDAGVALYGKIWRTHTWPNEESPQALKEKAQAYLKTGAALQTVSLKAVDMHFVDGDVEALQVGDKVRILSNPHGIDQTILCAKMDIDLLNPENTSYTFGTAPKALTDNTKRVEKDVNTLTGRGGGGRKSAKEEASDIIRWAKINVDEANAYIQLTAGELDKTNQRLSAAEIELDGANAQITLAASRMDDLEGRTTSAEIALDGVNAAIALKASKTEVDALTTRVTQAEIDIDGANASITLKASKSEVNELGERVSQAEIDIDGAKSQITLKANKTVVDGILSTGLAGVGTLSATTVAGNRGNFDSLSINGDSVVSHSVTVLKSVSLSAPKTTFTDYYGDQYTVVASASLTTRSETIVYLST